MKKIYIIGLFVLGISACKPNLSTQTPKAGNADFSHYVAIGNSLTAGYADGSLYRSGQLNSYPERLSEQFKLVGGGDFKQPLLTSESGVPSPKLVLGLDTNCLNAVSLSPISYPGPLDTAGSSASIAAQGPYNNVGVPGIRCVDYLTPGYAVLALLGGGVPYAYRFYQDPINQTPMDEALRIPATFFTCWLGNNDVLGYATAGGQGAVGGPYPSDISSTTAFETVYDSVINAMTANGAKGVLINIPDVTSIPFFTTIPANGLTISSATDAANLTEAYAIAGISTNFSVGNNYFMIQDHGGHIRQATSGDYILITTPQDSLTCGGWGSTKPIPAAYVLSSDEVANVRTATIAFNQVIANAAQAHNLPVVDMYSYLQTLNSGIVFNGVTFNAQFVTGGAFSLDGVHLTPRGYAIVANHILETINSYYGATIPMIDVNNYSGIVFP